MLGVLTGTYTTNTNHNSRTALQLVHDWLKLIPYGFPVRYYAGSLRLWYLKRSCQGAGHQRCIWRYSKLTHVQEKCTPRSSEVKGWVKFQVASMELKLWENNAHWIHFSALHFISLDQSSLLRIQCFKKLLFRKSCTEPALFSQVLQATHSLAIQESAEPQYLMVLLLTKLTISSVYISEKCANFLTSHRTSPCVRPRICEDTGFAGSWECNCPPGTTGDNCQIAGNTYKHSG